MPAGVPTWVPYAALATSIGALIIAALALLISFLSYRAGGRIVKVRAQLNRDNKELTVVIFNRGRADAEVARIELRVPPHTTWKVINLTPYATHGPPFNHIIAGGTSALWKIDLTKAIEADFERGNWYVAPDAHLLLFWNRPVAPRVRVRLSTTEKSQSPFVRSMGRYYFKRLYRSLFWAKYPKGNAKSYRPRKDDEWFHA